MLSSLIVKTNLIRAYKRVKKTNIISAYISVSLLISGLLFIKTASASPDLWTDSKRKSSQNKQLHSSKSDFDNLEYRALELDIEQFKNQYQTLSAQKSTAKPAPMTINIPLPEGDSVTLKVEENSILPADLIARFPNIKTWKLSSLGNNNDKNISGRMDFTENGFHAMLMLPDGDSVFVEPKSKGNSAEYLSFSKHKNHSHFRTDFNCQVHSNSALSNYPLIKKASNRLNRQTEAKPASKLITYRLAIATTGEYTQFHGSSSKALSAIVTTINRVNEIYERDLGITFQLIEEQPDLIYTNAETDPYSNFDSDAMLDENTLNLSSAGILDQSKYDLGHVFSTGSGGRAFLGSACSITKAGGTTGITSPLGDAFDIDFVAHELGHQLGANHTFNSETGNCSGDNRNGPTAVEPGSGSTIMGYAGICDENDIQAQSDPAFHAISITEIFTFTRNSNSEGSSCGNRIAVSNQDPVPNAGSDNNIPANTPFVLSGSGTDQDSDRLSYSWEQFDAGTASDVDVDTGDNAIIRSFLPVASGVRYIPRLSDLFQGRRLKSEKLPETNRELNFAMTVRDGKGGFDFDEMKLTVTDTGRPFSISSHSQVDFLKVGQNTQVNWDVAGTNTTPINCNSVDINLIQANGNRIGLKQQTANDGSEAVTIPAKAQGLKNTRIMIICSDSNTSFFNISASDLQVLSANENIPVKGGSSDGGGSFDYFLLVLLLLGILKKSLIKGSWIQYDSFANNSGINAK